MQILYGKPAQELGITRLAARMKELSFVPCYAIIQLGNREDSSAYIKAKRTFIQKVGIKEVYINLDEKTSEQELLSLVQKYNEDKSVQGIIVQLPLPAHIDSAKIIESIDPRKDIDGLTSHTVATPATARGIRELFEYYNIDLSGKKVTMIGASALVGKPTAKMCEKLGAIVTLCDSKTLNLPEKARTADILIVAIGKPRFIGVNYINKNQVIIDVGITRMPDGNLAGDVDFEAVKDRVSMITPVPGGVGQMTVLALFENLIDACYNQ